MALRIEYLLIVILIALLLSMLSIHPQSQSAKSAKGDKEIEFHNFLLSDIKQDASSQAISAKKMVKYEHYLDMDEIDLEDESGYRLLSQKAIYEKDTIYMDRGVKILHSDGSRFLTNSLTYNVQSKEAQTSSPFSLEFNSSIIEGENLQLNMLTNVISADNIEAKILF